MVIHNLYVRRPRFCPVKVDSVSVINPNAELAPSTSGQLFQAVPRRDSESTKRLHRVQLIELASCDTPKMLRTRSSRSLSVASVEDVLSYLGCEGPNHKHIIARLACYFKPPYCLTKKERQTVSLPHSRNVLEIEEETTHQGVLDALSCRNPHYSRRRRGHEALLLLTIYYSDARN